MHKYVAHLHNELPGSFGMLATESVRQLVGSLTDNLYVFDDAVVSQLVDIADGSLLATGEGAEGMPSSMPASVGLAFTLYRYK